MWFEHHRHPLLPRRQFALRWAKWALFALGVIAFSLCIGAVGYHFTEPVPLWLDAFHQAAMILTGMGPAIFVQTTAGKLFETLYALFSGVVFISVAGMLLGPPAHRVLHRFHMDEVEESDTTSAKRAPQKRGQHESRVRRELN